MNMGLIAHDSKKTLMQNFLYRIQRGILSRSISCNTFWDDRTFDRGSDEDLNIHKYLFGFPGDSS